MKKNKDVVDVAEMLSEGYLRARDAVSMLIAQGCGDPHFIPVFAYVGVRVSDYLIAVSDAVTERYNRTLSVEDAGALINNTRVSDVCGSDGLERILVYVVGAHAQFDARTEGDDIFTTRPYRCVTLRVCLPQTGDGLSDVIDLRADVLCPELRSLTKSAA